MMLFFSLDDVVPRAKWQARLPVKLAPAMRHKISTVVFLYTDTEPCKTREECVRALQGLQKHHIDHGMNDIPYSFILGGDSSVYEGRGWNASVPVPVEVEESPFSTLVIARIGPFQEVLRYQLEEFVKGYEIIRCGLMKSYINPNFEFKKIFKDWNKHEK